MSVRVVARIRPLLDKELEKDTIVRAQAGKDGKLSIVRIPNPKNDAGDFSFTFNAVYDMKTTQEELFTNEVAPHLKSLFAGLDVMIFAYGVTGTGKTHTMRGGLKLPDRGIIPRLLSGIYRRGRKVTKDSGGETAVAVTLSYYEIYNDKVYDLFEPPEKRSLAGLPLREGKDGKTIVVGLSERACDDLKDFEKLYIEANNNRSTAGTKLNAQSSRSHAIIMVKVIQTNGDQQLVSTASAIDLAGSEDNRRTDNNKERLIESANINKSLFVLSSCIDAIGRGDKRIPYRDSKMTRILNLGQNNGITIMILNLAPLKSYHLDTLSSLNVSTRAKRIEVREIENEIVFTQPPRTAAPLTGSTIQRQPLRPLANAHNTHANGAAQKGDKPPKAFSVYTDKSKPSGPRSSNAASQIIRRTNSTNKRSSDSTNPIRPTKMVRPNPTGVRSTAELSSAKIEEMIERKVQEALANRAMEQPAPNTSNEVSEAVQRRLEALEKRVQRGEAEDDARAEGLRFLLMAKQHKERGEDVSALKMYELAVPFFPGQEKLQKKIATLKAKIAAKREEMKSSMPEIEERRTLATVSIGQLPTLADSFETVAQEPKERPLPKARKARTSAQSDEDFNGSAIIQADDYDEDDSFSYKTSKSKKPKSKPAAKSALRIFADDADAEALVASTPKTKRLLDIVNSRDVAMIMTLRGVGAKKASDLVEYLELQNEDEGGSIKTLQQLYVVPGLTEKIVEKAYEGITALLV
ncbi:hypothetical protein EG329_005577 [Mollisiaceae sp. DMI_Dod_QoI]|nr:hypothetical protein EG329_005577 [Helotiales sp. DMI_Dod_QoI]